MCVCVQDISDVSMCVCVCMGVCVRVSAYTITRLYMFFDWAVTRQLGSAAAKKRCPVRSPDRQGEWGWLGEKWESASERQSIKN